MRAITERATELLREEPNVLTLSCESSESSSPLVVSPGNGGGRCGKPREWGPNVLTLSSAPPHVSNNYDKP